MAAGRRAAASRDRLRREGASDEELAVLAQTAREVHRLDAVFRPYLPAVLADQIGADASATALPAGTERVVSIMFADLAGFTPFSEVHEPREVVDMLNTYWATVVPIIDAAGGSIEHFAGDGVMALFNVRGDQPDHARRAAQAARRIVAAAGELAKAHPGWPVFRLGINTGAAVVGVVGADARRSFSAIGDPVNTAARLMTVGDPGDVIVGRRTWEMLGDPTAGEALGLVRVKGKRDAIEAWRLSAGVADRDPAST